MPILKKYYREMIILGLVAALLASFKSCNNTNSYGTTITECYIDTVVHKIPGATVVRYEKKLVPVITERYDTVYSFDTDTLISTINDTAYIYADIPVQEYKDSSYYIRTIGWLDSLSIYTPKIRHIKASRTSHWLMGQYSRSFYGLGYSIGTDRWISGVMYDIRNKSYGVTLGWRLNRPKLLINKK